MPRTLPVRAPAPRVRHAAPLPVAIAPMLAVAVGALPAGADAYAYEWKWDGVRAAAYWDGRRLLLRSRNQIDITARYPELQSLAGALGSRSAVLDGEIIAFDEAGRPSFAELQKRMHVADPKAVE